MSAFVRRSEALEYVRHEALEYVRREALEYLLLLPFFAAFAFLCMLRNFRSEDHRHLLY